jgi:hypothetical protein
VNSISHANQATEVPSTEPSLFQWCDCEYITLRPQIPKCQGGVELLGRKSFANLSTIFPIKLRPIGVRILLGRLDDDEPEDFTCFSVKHVDGEIVIKQAQLEAIVHPGNP